MNRKTAIIWGFALFVCAWNLVSADTPDWDPGSPITGVACIITPRQECCGDLCSPSVTVYTEEIVQFYAEAQDLDHKNDPFGQDGVHCDWSYTPEAGGDPVEMGKTKGNSYCTCEGYEETYLSYSWPGLGTYIVKCTMNDCHILADDPDSLVRNITVNVVDPPPPPLCVEFTYDENGNRDSMTDSRGTT
ncbi:MAG: hypothetical protein GTO63_16885, partial [Anaerolineae bacterium]|nr:hypothetical protein [Anaerolineae bacterium]NIN96474.1 hypothetical protein [Anaerolineae bacterium]NIQ81119.1 hypothetical protein [Anaerolineae bacterium]